MKTLIIFVGVAIAIVFGASAISVTNNAYAQTWTTTPNTFGGGTTTRGSNGSIYTTTPNTFGGGSTVRRRY